MAITGTEDQHALIIDALAYAQAAATDPGWSADVRRLINDLFTVDCPSCKKQLLLAEPDGSGEPLWEHISQYEAMACRTSRTAAAPGGGGQFPTIDAGQLQAEVAGDVRRITGMTDGEPGGH
jgi:hypothetical protein